MARVVEQPNHLSIRRRSAEDTEGATGRVLAKLEARGTDLTIQKILANSSTLFRPFILFSSALLFESEISRATAEILILWLARKLEVPYEWSEHVPLALASEVSEEQIGAIAADDLEAAAFSEEQLLAVSLARELLAERAISAETFSRSLAMWEVSGVLDVLAIVGWWGGTVRAMIDGLGLIHPDGGPSMTPQEAANGAG